MNICIFGAGAIGGYLAARLLRFTDHQVSVVARGEQLQAIQERGLRLGMQLMNQSSDLKLRHRLLIVRGG